MKEGDRIFASGVAGLVLAFSGLLAMVTGCQTRIAEDDALPSEPIALLHWEGKAARVRGEAFGGASELPPDPVDPVDPEGAEENSIRVHLEAQSSLRLAAKLGKHAGHLVLYWPETGEIERIEAAPANARPLAWSPDHQRLVFVSSHRDGRRQLYEYNLGRKDLTVLTVGPDEHTRADFDARGQLVIQKTESVAAGRPRQTAHLATSTGRLERLVAEGVRGGTLRILPAGDGIVYEQVKSRPRSDGPTVFESFVAFHGVRAGSQEEILARGREPDLTPDGAWIVFASPTSAGYRLRRMRPDGTSRVPMGGLNPGGGDERMPSVSPDGDYVAFIEDKGSSRRLAVRRFDGKRGRVLLANGWSEFPVW